LQKIEADFNLVPRPLYWKSHESKRPFRSDIRQRRSLDASAAAPEFSNQSQVFFFLAEKMLNILGIHVRKILVQEMFRIGLNLAMKLRMASSTGTDSRL
jgi:hypothetical protein